MTRKKIAGFIVVLLVMLTLLGIIIETNLYSNNNITRIACIGDSITEGTNYPLYLQNMLGADYIVGNFGTSGSTVQLETYTPYLYGVAFTRSKDFFPNIAVIMLGTNDARTDHVVSLDNFIADYMKLISEIQGLETKPSIFIVKPPPIFPNEIELNGEKFVEEIIPRIEQIADEQGLPLIDIYSELENHPEYFQDGVHPNSEGATIIANEVYKAIIRYTENL